MHERLYCSQCKNIVERDIKDQFSRLWVQKEEFV